MEGLLANRCCSSAFLHALDEAMTLIVRGHGPCFHLSDDGGLINGANGLDQEVTSMQVFQKLSALRLKKVDEDAVNFIEESDGIVP